MVSDVDRDRYLIHVDTNSKCIIADTVDSSAIMEILSSSLDERNIDFIHH